MKNLRRFPSTILAVAAQLLSGWATPSFTQVLAWTADDGGGVGSGAGDFFDPITGASALYLLVITPHR
ncbi:hypothetical protein [Adhaeretor mobilis]|uniref:hypothetical protein n=1 Tax=Adhaeretor mobilis TaxID=1930276 RepID=UPI0011A8F896|nr:hypothetical protein [Adhaeretor mobilis]